MKKSVLAASVAAMLALSGCGNGIGGAAEGATAVQPSRVSQEELRAAVSDEEAVRFYELRAWQPAWTRGEASTLVEALGEAARHALDPAEFLAEAEGAAAPAAREAALTKAALAYARALARGRADPGEIADIYTLERPEPDLAAGLHQALEGGGVAAWLDGLAPQDREYAALSEAYLRYARQAAEEGARSIEGGDSIREGDSDPRLPQIVEALRANGYLPPAEDGGQEPAPVYTARLAAAVQRMQADYGIADDGIIGPDTLEVLNTGAAERARILAVNLERRRWLARDPAATRIDVNTAAAVLDYWRDGRHADQRVVVVGQPGTETPQLGSPIFRLVANPSWTVPKSIEREEIAPRGEEYLRRNNMVRRDGWIVQQPGPTNALGLVKFDMHNDHSIYLHDTPAKALFQRNQRHFSHGCVRVSDALGFARLLADHEGKRDEFERALSSGNETFVPLDGQIPVRLVYHTAFLDQSGRIVFRTDPYGWDEGVAQALGLDARGGRRLHTHIQDVGP